MLDGGLLLRQVTLREDYERALGLGDAKSGFQGKNYPFVIRIMCRIVQCSNNKKDIQLAIGMMIRH